MSMYIGQSVASTLVLKNKAFMIDAHQMHQRGLEIVNVDFVLKNIVAVFVRRAV